MQPVDRILDNSNRDGNVVYIVRAIIQVIRKGDDDKKDDPGYVLIQVCLSSESNKGFIRVIVGM